MAVKFDAGGGNDFECQNPVRSNRYEIRMRQAKGRCAGGELFVYDKGVTTYELLLEFRELRKVEKDEMDTFFITHVDGMSDTFTYTDHNGNSWTARFLDPELIWREADDVYNAADNFTIGAVTYPSTTRKDGIWEVNVRLEVVAL